MKFCIRDLLLVTMIVALAVGWWVDRTRLAVEMERVSKLSSAYPQGSFPQLHFHLPNSSAPVPNPLKK